MSKGQLAVDGVVRTTARSLTGDDPRLLQLAEDALNGAFGDAYRLSDFPDADFRVAGDADKDMPVIAEKCPGWRVGIDAHDEST
jgi:hypothetical protein